MSKTRFQINNAMRKSSGNTRDRPEEKLVYEILAKNSTYISLEEQVTIKYENEQLREKEAIVDILFKDKFGSVVVRVNGPYHDEPTQKNKDDLQRLYLQRDLYIVIDIPHWKCPTLFKRNETKLTRDELYEAYKEVRNELNGMIFIPSIPKDEWLATTEHQIVTDEM